MPKVTLKRTIGLFEKGIEYPIIEKVNAMYRITYKENSNFKIRVAPFDIENI
tara:strand:+ start:69071 stop:69226 length:156 start_codon:yes stop_codon:yes gene_type:complete